MCIRCVIIKRVNCQRTRATISGASVFAFCCLAFCSSIRSIPMFSLHHLARHVYIRTVGDLRQLLSNSKAVEYCLCVDCVIQQSSFSFSHIHPLTSPFRIMAPMLHINNGGNEQSRKCCMSPWVYLLTLPLIYDSCPKTISHSEIMSRY